MSAAAELLADLQRRGVTLQAHGDKLRVSPKSSLTAAEQDAARKLKPELLRLLSSSTAPPVDLTHGLCEIRVRWWPATLWFVPDDRDAAALVREGIERYRIWTHAELASITSYPLEAGDYRNIMLARREFDGHVVESRPARPREGLEL